ncbi:hypothetical protein AMS68_000941 [Peltaster fructicola]|uniref:Uncharacterized protein n=1 Tax=Peltaster fructicola TaxID=286661 RepID=A0A6H0XL19_9PEZI|nr:hypothetical protein AMS68_000941 [Peltaster fructicola]
MKRWRLVVIERGQTTNQRLKPFRDIDAAVMRPPLRCLVQRTQEFVDTRGEISAADLFTLLPVCRRIHAETALMPFTANDFVFTSTYDLRKFTDFLTADQHEALQAIILTDSLDHALRQGERLRRSWNRAFTQLRSVMIVSGFGTNPCEDHGCAVYKRLGWDPHEIHSVKRNVRIVLAGTVQVKEDDLVKQNQDLDVQALTCQCESIYGFKMIDLGYATWEELSLEALSIDTVT